MVSKDQCCFFSEANLRAIVTQVCRRSFKDSLPFVSSFSFRRKRGDSDVEAHEYKARRRSVLFASFHYSALSQRFPASQRFEFSYWKKSMLELRCVCENQLNIFAFH